MQLHRERQVKQVADERIVFLTSKDREEIEEKITGGGGTGGGGVTVETDPTVPAWAKAETKPTYTAEEVGAAPEDHTHSPADIGAAPEDHTHDEYAPEDHTHSPADIGAVKKSGDTMTGTLYHQTAATYPIAFAIGNAAKPEVVSILMNGDGNSFGCMAFRQYGTNGKRENFNLPHTTTPTVNTNYNIHTTKTLKYAYGSTTISGAAETTIDYSSAGFTAVPCVTMNYSTTAASWNGDNGALKVYNKTTTGAKAIVGGSFNTVRQVDWIAIGV